MLESIRNFWNEALAIREARWVVTIAGFATVILVAFYAAKFLRELALGGGGEGLSESSDYLTEFKKLRDSGALDEAEYSRLKRAIPAARSGGADVVADVVADQPDKLKINQDARIEKTAFVEAPGATPKNDESSDGLSERET